MGRSGRWDHVPVTNSTGHLSVQGGHLMYRAHHPRAKNDWIDLLIADGGSANRTSFAVSVSGRALVCAAQKVMLLLTHDQHRTGRIADDFLGGAPQAKIRQTCARAGRNQQQVNQSAVRAVDDFAQWAIELASAVS